MPATTSSTVAMQLRIVGCSGGWPGPGRACSGYLLSAGGSRVLVDAGTGVLPELLRVCPLSEVDAVWVSHLHPDHCGDLPMIWHMLAYSGIPGPLRVFGPPGWPAAISGLLDEPDALGRMLAVVELSDGAEFTVGSLTLQAVAMRHSLPTFGLRARFGG